MSLEIGSSGRIAPAIAIVLGIVLRISLLAGASVTTHVPLIVAVTLARYLKTPNPAGVPMISDKLVGGHKN